MRRNDQVFQLSLTEIAFTLAFILLLLLGYLVFKAETERQSAENALSLRDDLETTRVSVEAARRRLADALADSQPERAQETISKLVAAEAVWAERDHLKARVEDLDAQVSMLAAIQDAVKAASDRPSAVAEEVDKALRLQEEVRKLVVASSTLSEANPEVDTHSPPADLLRHAKSAFSAGTELRRQLSERLGKQIMDGSERQVVEDLITSAKAYAENSEGAVSVDKMRRENSDLRGQLVFLKNRLEARGGRDYPPCWADEKTGKVEFLFAIDVTPAGAVVGPAWPSHRDAEARELPGLGEILSGSPHSNESFGSRVQAIFERSRQEQCRHYVQLRSSIPDAVQSDRARLMVESYFYKFEARR